MKVVILSRGEDWVSQTSLLYFSFSILSVKTDIIPQVQLKEFLGNISYRGAEMKVYSQFNSTS